VVCLFNVIAGAMAIPTDLKECCSVFQMRGIERWKKLILPGIFPYLVTGLVTASGGAWNASIVAEYFHFKGQIYTTTDWERPSAKPPTAATSTCCWPRP
jgi:NitT/TauT family transport system permease protein